MDFGHLDIIATFDATPKTTLIPALSFSGHTLESSISDIIDNSIGAAAKNVDVTLTFDGPNSTVSIADDGFGMVLDKMRTAVIYAYQPLEEKRSEIDLGRYSVGLDTASSSFCHNLFIFSKVKGGSTNCINFCFTSAVWQSHQVRCESNIVKSESGTTVLWRDLQLVKDPEENASLLKDTSRLSAILESLKLYLSKTFCFLIRKGLRIRVNGHVVEPWSPFDVNDDVQVIFRDSSYVLCGQKITVVAYLLPVFEHLNDKEKDYVCGRDGSSPISKEGFYVYRHNRLIIGGGWLGIKGLNVDPKSSYARIGIWFEPSAEIDRYLSVDFTKNSLIIPPDFSDYLFKIAKEAKSASSKHYDYKKNPRPYKKHKGGPDQDPWFVTRYDRQVQIQINPNNPLVAKYTTKLNKTEKNALFALLSKTFPASEFANFAPKVVSLTDDELRQMVESTYKDLRKSGKTADAAVKSILEMSPFRDDKYKNRVFSILYELTEPEETNK